ncbi:MAG: DUF697 domain-containing protein [Bacteroidetes bacterium]|nr:MAG: DUF697 domain-containing protein [Bacteroidota bacterium]
MENRKEKAQEVINSHVMWAMGAGAVPLPIIDVAAVTVIQLDMLKQLCTAYDVNYTESSGKSLISAIAGSTLAKLAASFVKGIPVVGSILGGVSMAAMSGASTYAMGQVFVNHFENGGSMFNFDMSWGKQQYEKEYEKGKEYASSVEKKDDPNKANSKGDIFAKLDELVKLKKSGILTDEEFNKKKEELMAKLYA